MLHVLHTWWSLYLSESRCSTVISWSAVTLYKTVFINQTHPFIIILNVLFRRHVSTLYGVIIRPLHKILISQRNINVTLVTIMYTKTKHVNVWDPVTHLK
jgi:hypothetical protein